MSKTIENFGKYLLLEKIASGGMAEVYLSKSTGAAGISRFIAIKRILPQYSDNPEFVEMFKEEAKIAVNLNHGNVVSIFDFGVEKSQFFLVMEYVEGQNLRQVLNHLRKENKQFSLDQIVYIIKEVAAGLDHAHRCLDGATGKPLNITHRDMSPQNVMISFEGEVKVVDFGIAKAESQMENTRAGTIKGKFGYMSPEQADGLNVDQRTDIFSLGIVLWELIANERLFASSSEAGTLRKIRECQIPSLRKINPSIPPELERICNKALAKDKSLRYQTASALHKDLNRFLNTQYPEFSAHDFSVFMKSAFSQMFLENRKKLVEFAKIQNHGDDRTMVTQTAEITNSNTHQPVGLMASEPPPSVSEEFNIDPTVSIKIDLKQLKKNDSLPSLRNQNAGSVFTAPAASISKNTRSAPRPAPKQQQQPKSSSSSSWVLMALTLAVAFSAYWFWDQSKKLKTPPVVVAPPTVEQQPEVTDMASTQLYIVNIESQPSGARIFIDGQDTGMLTPARKSLDANKEIRLGLRLQGYQYYERTELISQQAMSLKATLQLMPQLGYVSIDIQNGGIDPIVTINGQRLSEKLPIKNFAVPAGTEVHIEAHNPFTKLRAEKTVKVGINEKKSIRLILERQAGDSEF